MSKQEYDTLFNYIYHILENEECSINDILKRNIKKKYILPQSFINLFDDSIIIPQKQEIITSTYYKYIDKISLAIKALLTINEDINIFKTSLSNSQMLPDNFWNIINCIINEDNEETDDDIYDDIYKERPNYTEFIKNIREQKFKSGITIQATGTGKSFQILKLIDIYQHDNNNTQNDYLLIAPKIDILRDMFYKDNVLDKVKFDKLKRSNIIDIEKFNIVNLVTKNFDKEQFSSVKPNIIIANMQYLLFMNSTNISILKKNLKMCIFDECHNVSGDEIFNFIEKIDNIINIGFSATPLRNTTDKLLKKFYKIYGDGKKINIISSFDIFDGIAQNIILPFKHYFFEFKSCYKTKGHELLNQSDSSTSEIEYEDSEINNLDNITIDESGLEYNRKIVKDVIMTKIINELPYKKIICWCRTKLLAINWKEWFENNFKSYKIYLSISGTDNKENDNYLLFKHLNPINETSDIKAILICVGRCREGSDIEFVDCGIYLDPVKNRSVVVSMQTGGRIMRLDKYNKKTHAIIIEGYVSNDNNSRLSSELIINYYKKILQISEDKNNYIEKLKYLSQNTIYDINSKIIRLKIDNDNNHDCILQTDIKDIDWNNTKEVIKQYTKQQITLKTQKNSNIENNKNMLLIKENNFDYSKISNAFINNKKLEILNYSKLIILCYKEINDIKKVFNNAIIKLDRNIKTDKNFKYSEDINFSFQGQNSKYSITEVVRQCIINNLSFDIEIELGDKSDKKIIKLSSSL